MNKVIKINIDIKYIFFNDDDNSNSKIKTLNKIKHTKKKLIN